MIQFNQNAWLKPYINMNTKIQQKTTNSFEKDFLKLVNNAAFGKTMENVRKHRNVNNRNYLVQNEITTLQSFSQKINQ